MAIIKCKMCGGDIEFTPGATYGTCEYCGSTSTIPKADDEQKLNRYNRANHFRRQCEFDKAVAAYEKILEQDDTDAEAHWGAVLSRFGIEYVEDPATKRRIPTCHRVQVASILADADYLAAVEHAPDAESRRLYEEQATQIAEIQRGILAISANEKPYDVFICYKETDESGQRTRDSQWAQDVYYGLTDAGYKVFFSRITLEDKLGQQYEPYIFAALNSARVMVVIGSRPEYFNAVWVKNEWSRYLALMANDRKRLLIPCYRGMDPYDLPEELSTLQSQDMSKIGFMQDLLRGVKKVLESEKTPEPPTVVQQVVQTASEAAAPGVSSLMERAYLFMEDGDFASAGEYLNRVLDIDPQYAPAYAAKVCVTFSMRKESDLAETTFLYADNADWQKALRFADGAHKANYESYIAKVRERVDLQIRNFAYDCAVEMAITPSANYSRLEEELSAYRKSCLRFSGKRPDGGRRKNAHSNEEKLQRAFRANDPNIMTEQSLKSAAEMLRKLQDPEAAECAKQCLALAEQARQKKIYQDATEKYNRGHLSSPILLEKAAELYQSIPNYKDARTMAQQCLEEAEELRASAYTAAIEAINAAGEDKNAWLKAQELLKSAYLNGYRDVEEKRSLAKRRYNECAEAGNDETPIEWLVLDCDGDNALLLSRYGLDIQSYNDEYEEITWEICTLRTWLNDDFINRAFTTDEQAAILLTNVDNSSKQGYWSTSGGNDTQDKIFLLSYAEANEYLGVTRIYSNTQSSVSPTAYAIAQGASTSVIDTGNWWLRSPGDDQDCASCVTRTIGSLSCAKVYYDDICVRPALWVDINSGIF